MVNVAATPPVIASTAVGRIWLGNAVSGTSADDPTTIARIIRAEVSIPFWRRNVVTQSYWSGWLHQAFSCDISQRTSGQACDVVLVYRPLDRHLS